MIFTYTSKKSVKEVVATIEEKAADFKFGVQHIHNVQEKLESKGVELENECQIIDICNPHFAKRFLEVDMTIAAILPCSISVYTDKGETHVIMNSVTQLVDDINPELVDIAAEVQEILLELIEACI